MKPRLIQQGAEAKIILNDNIITKDRIAKGYRLKILDEKIRKQRTKREAKLLEKASKLINCPKPLLLNHKTRIKMPFIKGKKLSEHLDNFSKKQAENICLEIGKSLAKLHDNDIIHGDLTTSNMILKGGEVVGVVDGSHNNLYFIDFGLGFHSHRFEDKAVDLHLIRQALEAKHFKNWENYYKFILKGYKSSKNYSKVLEHLKKVESRGRYKNKY